MAPENVPEVHIQFCGSSCWNRSRNQELAAAQGVRGSEVFAELKAQEGATLQSDGSLKMVTDYCSLTAKKAQGCLGLCRRDPAAVVNVPNNGVSTAFYIAAKSPEVIFDTIQNALKPRG